MFRAFDNRPVSCRAAKCCLTLKTEMRYALHLQRIHIHGRHSKFSRCSRESAWLLARNYRCVPGSIGHAACRIQKLFPERRMTHVALAARSASRIGSTNCHKRRSFDHLAVLS